MSKAVKKKAPRKRANGYKMPERIPLGEIITDLGKNKWIIGPSIGVGGFGEIYSAAEYENKKPKNYEYVIKIEPRENGPLFVENNFYMRNAKKEDISNWMKLNKIKSLGMPKYIGSGTHECNGLKYRFLVMERFGRDIWNIFLESGRSFPELTVFQIAYQILNVLEYIHSKGYVHADIKGANILLNSDSNVFLVDFGLASRFSTKELFVNDPKKAHNGTIEYTSRDAHNGVPTRRGDLEILAYNMLHWLGNNLPWEKLTDVKIVQQEKEKFMSDIPQVLKNKFSNVPDSLVKFFQYIITLKHDTEPDYKKCRTLFLNGIKNSGGSLNSNLNFLTKNKKTPVQKKVTPKASKLSTKRFEESFSSSEIDEREMSASDEEETKVTKTNSARRNISKNYKNENSISNSSPNVIPKTPSPPKKLKKIKKVISTNKVGHVLKTKLTSKKTVSVEKENEKTSVKRTVRTRKVVNYSDSYSSPEMLNLNSKLASKRTLKTSSDEVSPAKIKKNTTKTVSSWKNFPTVINCNVEKPGEYKKKSNSKK